MDVQTILHFPTIRQSPFQQNAKGGEGEGWRGRLPVMTHGVDRIPVCAATRDPS